MNNILITGALGFIGSNYAKQLTNSGYDVIILDKQTYAADIRRIANIKDIHNVKLYIGDICDRKLIEDIFKNIDIDVIVNFAADTHVDNSIINSEPFIHSNYIGVWNLLEFIKKEKGKSKDIKLVQISTDEVYGDIYEGSFDENSLLRPSNPYSATKASADLLALSYKRTFGLNICITRTCNNYGTFQYEEKFIPRMIKLGMEGKNLEVYGNGKNVRQWIWVEDNCDAIKLIMEKGKSGEIYNIGSPWHMTNNEIAEIISKKFRVGINYIQDRPGHDIRYSVNYTKLHRELGWEPTIDIYKGIEKTIDFYIKNY